MAINENILMALKELAWLDLQARMMGTCRGIVNPNIVFLISADRNNWLIQRKQANDDVIHQKC